MHAERHHDTNLGTPFGKSRSSFTTRPVEIGTLLKDAINIGRDRCVLFHNIVRLRCYKSNAVAPDEGLIVFFQLGSMSWNQGAN